MLQRLVKDGALGESRLIDASARMNMAYQGTHTLQAIRAFNPGAHPGNIFGQIAGAQGLQESARQHYAPDQTMSSFTFDNGVSALLRCGANAPYVLEGDERTNVHKRIAVYGTKGFLQWTMWGWEVGVGGSVEQGEHDYGQEDLLGQAAMTEAMFDWMQNDGAVHPLNLNAALLDFNIVLKTYISAINHRSYSLTDDFQMDLIQAMRDRLR
jgi:hypothetical protein